MYAMVNQAKRTIFLYEAVEIKPTIGYNKYYREHLGSLQAGNNASALLIQVKKENIGPPGLWNGNIRQCIVRSLKIHRSNVFLFDGGI